MGIKVQHWLLSRLRLMITKPKLYSYSAVPVTRQDCFNGRRKSMPSELLRNHKSICPFWNRLGVVLLEAQAGRMQIEGKLNVS
jgi:hypothetical protein